MQLPSGLLQGATPAVSGIANLAGALVTVAGAPGAGLRIRLWLVATGCTVTTQAPLRVFYNFQAGGGGGIVVLSRVGYAGVDLAFPGGFQLPTNQSVQMSLTADIAGLNCNTYAFYTIESA